MTREATQSSAAPRAGEGGRPGWAVALLRRVGALLQRLPRGLAWLPALAWMAFIWRLSEFEPATPSGEWHPLVFVFNFGHAPLFGLLAVFLALGLPRERGWPRLDRRSGGWIVLLVLAYGVVDELHQGSVPGRDADPWDLLTDGTGAAVTLWCAALVGSPRASGRELARRVALGLFLCAVPATLASVSSFLSQ